MRYIGNKTRLLPFILRTLEKEGIGAGAVHDAFAGTASVSRALKESGWQVYSSDLLMSSYVFQRAYVVADGADSTLNEKAREDRKSTRLNSSHMSISYAVFCLKKKI